MTLPIHGLFETHLTVAGLPRSMAFYAAVLGLELARVLPERKVAFYWIGGSGKGAPGLQRGLSRLARSPIEAAVGPRHTTGLCRQPHR